ncbi:MAG: succinylglutamate desuccinylase/aspartoacylase family protein [Sphingopyxis sp.]|nr:succinylglutamate desuccinylase/aspartoacylase family protein [Sphingopyxis sp.]
MRMILALAAALALANPAAAQTNRTGDRIDGVAVIDRLDANDLGPGEVHRFWFRTGDTALGQAWHVPVVVVKGAKPGPRLLLTAGIHGDELNGIAVIHRLARDLDTKALSGSLVMVPGLNTPGLNNSTRAFTPRGGTGGENLNRVMPGKDVPGSNLIDVYAHRLWHRLMRPNADRMIDLHTQSRGTSYNLYAFVSSPEAREIAEAIAPDTIRLDPGQRGTVENEMVPAGVPAITLELGAPEVWDQAMIARSHDGILRVLASMKMLPASAAPPARATPFVANNQVQLRSPHGGWVTLHVRLNDMVAKDQPVATIADAFGQGRVTLTAPVAGQIVSVSTDPRNDVGDMVARIGYFDPDPKCAAGC